MSKSKMTQCKACGAEIAKSAKTCPHCGAKNKRHKALGIVLAILGILVIIGAATGSAETPEIVGETPPAAVEPEKTPAAPDKAEATSPAPVEPEKTEFAIGDVVELGNVVVTLVDVSQSTGNSFMTPSDGNTFVTCEFKIENNSTSDIAVSSMMSFSAYADDYAASYSLYAMTSTDKTQLDGTVAAGKKMSGVVGYEIPKDWKELEIRYTPDYWNGKEIIFIANNE